MTMITTYTLVTRFNLTQIQGNQVVDWAVVDGNYQLLGNNAAHLTAGNAFSGAQTFAGNIGLTGAAAHRRVTLPIPPTNETDRVHFQAEAVSSNGTFLGLAGPVSAGAGQRKSTFVLHGVEPTGTTTPAGLTFLLDEDNHRSSIQALGTYQDLTAPSLQLGAGGADRFVIPSAGTIAVTGAMSLTGSLTATAGSFTTLSASGGVSFASTSTFTGLATFNGGLTSATTLTVTAPINVSGLATFSGGITTGGGLLNVTGNTSITGTLNVSGAVGFASSLTVGGATSLGGTLYFGGGAAYVQYYGGSYVQISQLTVTPGATALAGLTVNGGTTLNGALTAGNLTTPGSVAASGYVAAGPAISGAAGDLNANRNNGTGYCFLANGSHYLGFDGSNYQMPTSNLYVAGDLVCLAGSGANTLSNKTLVDPKLSNQVQLGGASITLPNVSGMAGAWRYIKAWGGNCVIYLTNGVLVFGGATYGSGAYTLANGDSFSLYCEGANWWVI